LKQTLYIILFSALIFSSCREEYIPDFEEERKIVLDCTLQPGEDAKAKVHVTNSILDTTESYFYPESEDANLSFILVGDTIGRFEITVDVPGKDVQAISALTTVPFATPLETVTVINPAERNQVGNDIFYSGMLVEIEIPEPIDPLTYYQLKVQIVNAELASTGIIEFIDLSKEDVKVLTTGNGIQQFIHKSGIFIDNSRLDDNTIQLMLSFDVFPLYEEYIESITFTLNSVNSDFMEYHENTDRELRTSALPLDDPQISANNIQNGYGLFGAFSSSSLSVPLE